MNNANKLLWWLLGILATVVIGAGGMWVKSIGNEVTRLSQASEVRGERVSLIEGELRGVQARLERIENKLDKISERLERR